MSLLFRPTQSALNVAIPGTIGTFKVARQGSSGQGVEVRYLLTHVTLDSAAGQFALLNMLAPVREVFDLKQLGFDEIMQRDIDDARVSLDLIPYLLDTSTSGLIKLFPPVVAVALPLQSASRRPANRYAKVTKRVEPYPDAEGMSVERLTAGELGSEQFEFEQYFRNGKALSSDGAQLKLSDVNCALAIVDGQHRAMALLALYRNLVSGWADARRSPYKSYYDVWPDAEIRQFDLSALQLPLIICTFPQLDEENDESIDVVRAARRVFLTLNKTAKKVSDSRNRLLNDQDIVAECLRETLSHIKAFDVKDSTGLRIWNIELDQEGDRTRVSSPVAFSGVSHLYHIIETLLMSADRTKGLEARGKGRPVKRLDHAYRLLGLSDDLLQDVREANSRFNYSDDIADKFRSAWQRRFVPCIVQLLGDFHPLAAFSAATLGLHRHLQTNPAPELEKMLFDGQATSRTFDEFREGLDRRNKEHEKGWTTPAIDAVRRKLEGTANARETLIQSMRAERCMQLLKGLGAKAKSDVQSNGVVLPIILKEVDSLYSDVFSTVAFQTALICTFCEAVEQVFHDADDARDTTLLAEYLTSLHKLFEPKNTDGVRRLLAVFVGEADFSGPVVIRRGGPTFHNVVLSGELQPAEWPKYRYVLLELWNPADPNLAAFVREDRETCRASVFRHLLDRKLRTYCEENRLNIEEVPDDVSKEMADRAADELSAFVRAVTGEEKFRFLRPSSGLTSGV